MTSCVCGGHLSETENGKHAENKNKTTRLTHDGDDTTLEKVRYEACKLLPALGCLFVFVYRVKHI